MKHATYNSSLVTECEGEVHGTEKRPVTAKLRQSSHYSKNESTLPIGQKRAVLPQILRRRQTHKEQDEN